MVILTGIPGLQAKISANDQECLEYIGRNDENDDAPDAYPQIYTRWIASSTNADIGVSLLFGKTFRPPNRTEAIRIRLFADGRRLTTTTVHMSVLIAQLKGRHTWRKLMESVIRTKSSQKVVQRFQFRSAGADAVEQDGDGGGSPGIFVNEDVEEELDVPEPSPDSDEGDTSDRETRGPDGGNSAANAENEDEGDDDRDGSGKISLYLFAIRKSKAKRRGGNWRMPTTKAPRPVLRDTAEASDKQLPRDTVEKKQLTHTLNLGEPIFTSNQASVFHSLKPHSKRVKPKVKEWSWTTVNESGAPFVIVHFKFRSQAHIDARPEIG